MSERRLTYKLNRSLFLKRKMYNSCTACLIGLLVVVTFIIGYHVHNYGLLSHVYLNHPTSKSSYSNITMATQDMMSEARQWTAKTSAKAKGNMSGVFEHKFYLNSDGTKIQVRDDKILGILSRDRQYEGQKNRKENGRAKSLRYAETGADEISVTEERSTSTDSENRTKYLNGSSFLIQGTVLPNDVRNEWEHTTATFILSEIGYNSSTVTGYEREIKLNGWQDAKGSLVKIKCCVFWTNDNISEYTSPNKTTRGKRLRFFAVSISCPVQGSLEDVKGARVQFANATCPVDETNYIKPFIPRLQSRRHSFAICLKILYGNIDNKLLIDWLEFYREMRVDKIFMYVYNLTQETLSIIEKYASLGLLETRKYDFPWKTGRIIGTKNQLFFEDEQVVVYDCFYRLYGYDFIAIVDLDEFILPRKHDNIKETMEYLMSMYPEAAGFAMKMFIFNLNWGATRHTNGSNIEQYIHRTVAIKRVRARGKNILIPSRIFVDHSFYTHAFRPKPGYKRYTVNEAVVAINHYRKCYPDLSKDCNKRKRVVDTAILKVVDRFKNRTTL